MANFRATTYLIEVEEIFDFFNQHRKCWVKHGTIVFRYTKCHLKRHLAWYLPKLAYLSMLFIVEMACSGGQLKKKIAWSNKPNLLKLVLAKGN